MKLLLTLIGVGSATLLLALVSSYTPLAVADVALTAAVSSVPGDLVHQLALAATWLGTYRTVLALAALFAVVLAIWTRRLIEPVALLIVGPLTVRLAEALKAWTDRERPATAYELSDQPLDAAFPSSHTANGTVLLLLTALLVAAQLQSMIWRRATIGLAAGVALLIGLSRVHLGYHWASDVVGGWGLAVAVTGLVLLSTTLLRRRLAERRDQAPVRSV